MFDNIASSRAESPNFRHLDYNMDYKNVNLELLKFCLGKYILVSTFVCYGRVIHPTIYPLSKPFTHCREHTGWGANPGYKHRSLHTHTQSETILGKTNLCSGQPQFFIATIEGGVGIISSIFSSMLCRLLHIILYEPRKVLCWI